MRLPAFILCFILFPALGYSQEAVITVQNALDLAMKNNPELNQIEEQVQVQRTQLGISLGVEKPDVFYLREGVNDGVFTEQRWGISQTIAFPLTGYYQNRKARSEVQSIEMQVEAKRIQVRGSVKKAYVELAFSIKYLELIQSEVELARELREIAQARLDVGESTELDLIQAEIQYSQAQNSSRQARQLVDSARYALFRIIGLGPEQQQYGISFPDTLSYFETNIYQEPVLQELDKLPEVQSVLQNAKSAKMDIRVARSSYLPDLRVDYYRQDYGGGFRFNGFQVGVSVPLWFGLNEKRDFQRANAEYRQAEWSVNESLLQVREEAENAWHRYETSRENILAYRDFIHSRSFSLLELSREGYQIGELDLLHVLEAQRTYIAGQLQYYQALRDYYLQIIELERFLPDELVFTE